MNNETVPVCECGHDLSGHYKHGCNEVERGPDYEQCHCEQFTDARIAALRAENERLTPTATRAVPERAGHYWFRPDDSTTGESVVVEVVAHADGLMGRTTGEFLWIWLRSTKGYWSKEPIPEMVVPEKGETE